jgi:hypothetical protein
MSRILARDGRSGGQEDMGVIGVVCKRMVRYGYGTPFESGARVLPRMKWNVL